MPSVKQTASGSGAEADRTQQDEWEEDLLLPAEAWTEQEQAQHAKALERVFAKLRYAAQGLALGRKESVTLTSTEAIDLAMWLIEQDPFQEIDVRKLLTDPAAHNLFDVSTMKKFYPKYNPETARAIVRALPRAFYDWRTTGGEWGPRWVAQHAHLNQDTAGRYFKAWRAAGYQVIGFIPVPGRKVERKVERKSGRKKTLR